MKKAAMGMRVHSGWAAMVAVALDGRSPCVLWRARPHLVEAFTFEFRQPYHTAEKLPIGQARVVIERARETATRLARLAFEESQAAIRRRGFETEFCGMLLASAKPLPPLEKILLSHALIHTADGELFRQALLEAARNLSLEAFTVKEKELIDRAGRELKLNREEIHRHIAEAGQSAGRPWAQDEKLATLVAWTALVNSRPAAKSAGTRVNRDSTPGWSSPG